MTAAFSPGAAPAGSVELEAYHYGRAAAYHTAAELVARLPGPRAQELAARLQALQVQALEDTEAAHRGRAQVDQARAAAAVEPEDGGDPATELYWRRVELAALDGLRAALGTGAWEADPAVPGALIGTVGGVLVRVQPVNP